MYIMLKSAVDSHYLKKRYRLLDFIFEKRSYFLNAPISSVDPIELGICPGQHEKLYFYSYRKIK